MEAELGLGDWKIEPKLKEIVCHCEINSASHILQYSLIHFSVFVPFWYALIYL